MHKECDIAIIGGGIVGLSAAYKIQQKHPSAKVILLEKEEKLARHQTGRNSGVIHSGIYYKPGSLKAKNCLKGKKALLEFCREHSIEALKRGKVIVAVREKEIKTLNLLYERGKANGIRCELVDAKSLSEIEPNIKGLKGIYIEDVYVVDFREVALKLAAHFESLGGEIIKGFEVKGSGLDFGKRLLLSDSGKVGADLVVNCAGLYSDRVASILGTEPNLKIVPFRGEYYILKPELSHLCNGLIYPVPNPDFPFLGVHFTKRVDGTVECGPNAVLAFGRESYSWSSFDLKDLWESVTYPGFRRLAKRYWKEGVKEMVRSLSKALFVASLKTMMPKLKGEWLKPAAAGVRAQAVSQDGMLLDDFVISQEKGVINILNAPSPAATSCLSIGAHIADLTEESL
ncbi:MAG: L-2-hydroxyglutarate oxidase [Candidatus Dadabacteria bacterium]|nr:MAG: L-2-hydroxyglutarate oxidase [Candidatus Dadabacteria bacterium]